jgi:hypothetical protein
MTKIQNIMNHMGKRWKFQLSLMTVEFGTELKILEMCSPSTEV